jgi:hypothetical protein
VPGGARAAAEAVRWWCWVPSGCARATRGEAGAAPHSPAPLPTKKTPAPKPPGHFVILVSSGAIGVGCQRLGLTTRPTKIAQKQALAAVGQGHLMRYYEDFFQALGLVSRAGRGVAESRPRPRGPGPGPDRPGRPPPRQRRPRRLRRCPLPLLPLDPPACPLSCPPLLHPRRARRCC